MRILILGATGRTGKWLVKEALGTGLQVNVLVRNPARLPAGTAERIQVFTGDTTGNAELLQAMLGCAAVINALNISRQNDFPWSKLRTPVDLLSVTMANVIQVAGRLQINRIIVLSAWGVGDSRKQIPGWFRWVIDHSNISYAYADHYRQEQLLRGSNLNYTVIRPVGLTNFIKRHSVRVSINHQPKPHLLISRRNVATFAISILGDMYTRQTVTVSQ